MIRLTINTSTRVRDGGSRPPEIMQAVDEEALMDKWNSQGAWVSFTPDEFRQAIAQLAGVELPASDDELLEGAVANSEGNMKLENVDSVASRIARAR